MGEKDTAVAWRGAAQCTRGQQGAARGGKGKRRATEGGAGQGAQRERNKGGAPTWHGRGTPRGKPHGGERTRRRETGEVPQQQKSRVVVSCVHTGRRVKKNKTNQANPRGDHPKKKPKDTKQKQTHRGGGGRGQAATNGVRTRGRTNRTWGRSERNPAGVGHAGTPKKKSEWSAKEGVRVGATSARGTKRSFGPAPLGCWRPGGV